MYLIGSALEALADDITSVLEESAGVWDAAEDVPWTEQAVILINEVSVSNTARIIEVHFFVVVDFM